MVLRAHSIHVTSRAGFTIYGGEKTLARTIRQCLVRSNAFIKLAVEVFVGCANTLVTHEDGTNVQTQINKPLLYV